MRIFDIEKLDKKVGLFWWINSLYFFISVNGLKIYIYKKKIWKNLTIISEKVFNVICKANVYLGSKPSTAQCLELWVVAALKKIILFGKMHCTKKKEINSNTQMSKNYFEIMMTKIMFKYIKVWIFTYMLFTKKLAVQTTLLWNYDD